MLVRSRRLYEQGVGEKSARTVRSAVVHLIVQRARGRTGWYVLMLNTKDLKGFINGRTKFTEIIKNQVTASQQQPAISADIKPIIVVSFNIL